jgi:hypothetical protein
MKNGIGSYPWVTADEVPDIDEDYEPPAHLFAKKLCMSVVASNGFQTIGYDRSGVAGKWPGDRTMECNKDDFIKVDSGHLFPDNKGKVFVAKGKSRVEWARCRKS